MRQAERDIDQLAIIVRYYDRLSAAVARFGADYATFESDSVYQDSCSLCIIQIGEAVHRLSDGSEAAHPEIEWSRIYGMRCHLVHGYESFDAGIAWDAVENHIPPLLAFCEPYVAEWAN